MFERFTELARQALVTAQDEARSLNHHYVGTEHLLLGLVRVEDGLAAQVLAALGVTFESVHSGVERIVGRGDEMTTGQIPFTPRAKKVLELALREALAIKHNYIGTEHLLLGLTHDGGGVAARILAELGLERETIRAKVFSVLSGGGPAVRGPFAPMSFPAGRVAVDYDVKTLDGASDTWPAQLGAWRSEGWELISVVQEGDAVRAILERRRRDLSA